MQNYAPVHFNPSSASPGCPELSSSHEDRAQPVRIMTARMVISILCFWFFPPSGEGTLIKNINIILLFLKLRKNSIRRAVEKMCAEAEMKLEEAGGEVSGGRGRGCVWSGSGNGYFHGGYSPSFKGWGIGDCDGDSKKGASEIILILLSDIPFFEPHVEFRDIC